MHNYSIVYAIKTVSILAVFLQANRTNNLASIAFEQGGNKTENEFSDLSKVLENIHIGLTSFFALIICFLKQKSERFG